MRKQYSIQVNKNHVSEKGKGVPGEYEERLRVFAGSGKKAIKEAKMFGVRGHIRAIKI